MPTNAELGKRVKELEALSKKLKEDKGTLEKELEESKGISQKLESSLSDANKELEEQLEENKKLHGRLARESSTEESVGSTEREVWHAMLVAGFSQLFNPQSMIRSEDPKIIQATVARALRIAEHARDSVRHYEDLRIKEHAEKASDPLKDMLGKE